MTLEKASKIDLIRTFNTLSTKKIVEAGYPSISLLNKQHTPEKVEKVLAILVNDLTTAFEGELTHQAEELAIEINALYRNITLEDVYLCFATIKTGYHHGKLTQNKVLNALKTQFENRLNAFEKMSYEKHISLQYHSERTSTYRDELTLHQLARTVVELENPKKQKK